MRVPLRAFSFDLPIRKKSSGGSNSSSNSHNKHLNPNLGHNHDHDHHNDDYSNYDGEKARKMQRMWSTYLNQNGSVVVTEDEISRRYAEVCYRK